MKELENSQLATISGGMSQDTCGAVITATYLFAVSGFWGLALFTGAVALGAGCAGQ